MSTNIPLIILKQALSFDGYLDNESRVVFSNTEDKILVKKLRSKVDAILVASNTVRKDDPQLLGEKENPLRVVVEGRSKLSLDYQVLSDNKSPTIVFRSEKNFDKNEIYENSNLTFVEYKGLRISVFEIVRYLHSIGVESLLIEGGADIASQFIDNKMIDIFRFAYSSKVIKNNQATKLYPTKDFVINSKPIVQNLNGMAIYWYAKDQKSLDFYVE